MGIRGKNTATKGKKKNTHQKHVSNTGDERESCNETGKEKSRKSPARTLGSRKKRTVRVTLLGERNSSRRDKGLSA